MAYGKVVPLATIEQSGLGQLAQIGFGEVGGGCVDGVVGRVIGGVGGVMGHGIEEAQFKIFINALYDGGSAVTVTYNKAIANKAKRTE